MRADSIRLKAIRVVNAVQLGGHLREPFWEMADSITEFRQREPDEGALSTERTVVKHARDEDALYVGSAPVTPTFTESAGRSSAETPTSMWTTMSCCSSTAFTIGAAVSSSAPTQTAPCGMPSSTDSMTPTRIGTASGTSPSRVIRPVGQQSSAFPSGHCDSGRKREAPSGSTHNVSSVGRMRWPFGEGGAGRRVFTASFTKGR